MCFMKHRSTHVKCDYYMMNHIITYITTKVILFVTILFITGRIHRLEKTREILSDAHPTVRRSALPLQSVSEPVGQAAAAKEEQKER